MNDHELDRQIDASLRGAFVPPAPATLAAMAARATGVPRRGPIWPWLMAAAALLVVSGMLAMWPARRGPEGHDGAQLGAMWAAAYHDAAKQGFGSVGCCQPDPDLSKASSEQFSCGLRFAPNSAVALLGSYSGLPTGGCMALLARADGAPVCVCVVPAKQDPKVELPAGSGLHLARREVGDLVLYALSKSPGVSALESFSVP